MATMTTQTAGFGLAHQASYELASSSSDGGIDNILLYELSQLDGVSGHNPDTGEASTVAGQFLKQYTTKLFGSPYQLLDSVDRRFPGINDEVGAEYLRNFLLNSPILHIRPGMPHYTGGNGLFGETIKDIFMNKNLGQSILTGLAKATIFNKGQQLQRRMFGFRENYLNYMSYVNYMCRSAAIYLGIEKMGTFVAGTNGMQEFTTIRWENYRMLNTYVHSMTEYFGLLAKGAGTDIGGFFTGIWRDATSAANAIAKFVDPTTGAISDQEAYDKAVEDYNVEISRAGDAVNESWNDVNGGSGMIDTMDRKVKSVSFMVEPVPFNESLNNATAPSAIGGAIDALDNGIGSEIAFITNSHADVGVIGELTKFIGGTVEGLAESLSKMIQPVTGGFVQNLFSGALGALKGQKMIYPDIYKNSNSSMNYEFSVTLSSPYGDAYNYYMNIVVPLLHLIGLAAPRMISANTTTSPFLVQAYIPGMATCQLGIIESMNIIKNPTSKHVSVHGYPLTIKVQFTIKELYNAMAISPANDPASFMFNETLNDYLINMSGLIPSLTAYRGKRETAWKAVEQYFNGELWNDVTAGIVEGWENMFMNYQ